MRPAVTERCCRERGTPIVERGPRFMQTLQRPAALPLDPAPRTARAPIASRLRSSWNGPFMLAALAAVLVLGLALRLPNLSQPDDNFDEGAYLESILLMRHGYRPFADINTGEGPLNLYLAYVSYSLGGYTLSAARTGTVLASLIGLLGVA